MVSEQFKFFIFFHNMRYMFGKGKTIFDYIKEHTPFNSIDEVIIPEYMDNTVSDGHLTLDDNINEYWDVMHPLTKDYINSYANTYNKITEELGSQRSDMDNVRRQLSFEQQNVNELNDKIRELQKNLQEMAVEKRDLEDRLNDTSEMMENKYKGEIATLKILADAKLPEGSSVDNVLNEVSKAGASSEEVKRLNDKIKTLEEKIEMEREENEKIQGEISTSFMEKLLHYDEMINNYKERLGEE